MTNFPNTVSSILVQFVEIKTASAWLNPQMVHSRSLCLHYSSLSTRFSETVFKLKLPVTDDTDQTSPIQFHSVTAISRNIFQLRTGSLPDIFFMFSVSVSQSPFPPLLQHLGIWSACNFDPFMCFANFLIKEFDGIDQTWFCIFCVLCWRYTYVQIYDCCTQGKQLKSLH